MEFKYINTNNDICSDDINTLFPNWEAGKENLCVFSPHDDDALIGAGYAIKAAQKNGAEVYVFIFCSGNAGYSKPEQRESIVDIRKDETVKAYAELGVKEENIIRFDFCDFTALRYIGWKLDEDRDGSFKLIITALRKFKITRVLVPNHYREHIDHTAVYCIGAYDSPQAGDPVVVDWGEPNAVKSVAEYSVWADFSPEDALVEGRPVRANRIVVTDEQCEGIIQKAIKHYESQGEIIKGLVKSRQDRRIQNGMYMELYILFDPRPKLDFKQYKNYLSDRNLL